MCNTSTPTLTLRSLNSPKRFPKSVGGPAKKMRVLGIDCGSRVTGYGVIDSDGADCVFVQCGAIRSKPSDPIAERLKSIHNGIVEVIRELEPSVAAFESLFY